MWGTEEHFSLCFLIVTFGYVTILNAETRKCCYEDVGLLCPLWLKSVQAPLTFLH